MRDILHAGLAACAAAFSPAFAQPAGDGAPAYTLETVMADTDWLGRQPQDFWWDWDGRAILYERDREGSALTDEYLRPLGADGDGSAIETAALHEHLPSNAVWTPDRRLAAYVRFGDIFVRERASGALVQLTRTQESERDPLPLTDGRIAFRQGDAFYAARLDAPGVEELARWRFSDEPEDPEPGDFIAREQADLIAWARKTAETDAERRAREEAWRAGPAGVAEPVYLGDGRELVAASLSPSGRHLLIAHAPENRPAPTDPAEGGLDDARAPVMPRFVTLNGGISVDRVRPRVAEADPQPVSLTLVDLETGEASEVALEDLPGRDRDPLAAVRRENARELGEAYDPPEFEGPRPIRLITGPPQNAVQWSEDGARLAVMVEAIDNKDRWIVSIDLDSAEARTEHRLTDEAWINAAHNEFGWTPGGGPLWYLSEESGSSHLYVKTPGARRATALTQGDHVVSEVTPLPDGSGFLYVANAPDPGVYEVFRVSLDGGAPEALTDTGGLIEYALSPDGDRLALRHSRLNQPPELYLAGLDGAAPERLTQTVSDAFLSLPVVTPEIVDVPVPHLDRPVRARLYLPPEGAPPAPEAGRPAVVFIHGAGYLQNAHYGWSSYFREHMFHGILARRGYVVLDMDYRASRGYGRDWRTAIYREMGPPELEDILAGVDWIAAEHGVDAGRVGVYGGSYGGFMTLTALFQAPGRFQAGAALRSVTDWAHYNFGYTSNILNTPQIDPLAYRRSSPIYFAEGLEDRLLLAAPMVDDNVFFHDTVRLVQRLIELEKTGFETAIYPVEPHGFIEPSSWLDEYRRIDALFTQTIGEGG